MEPVEVHVGARSNGNNGMSGEGVFTGVFVHYDDWECSDQFKDYASGRDRSRGGG